MTDHDHGEPLTIDDVMIGLGRQQVRAIRAEAALEQAEARVDQLTDAAEHWRTRSHALTNELALTRDTLERRTQSHTNLVNARLACPRCSTLPIEETPA